MINITRSPKENFLLEFLHHDSVFKTNVGDVRDRVKVVYNGAIWKIESSFCYALEPSIYSGEIEGRINITTPGVQDIAIIAEAATHVADKKKLKQVI